MKKNSKENNKKNNILGKILSMPTQMQLIVIIVPIVIIVVSLLFLNNWEAKADVEYMNNLLQKSSELTSAKLTLTGIADYKDEGIPILNRSDFIMVFDATVRAGIDIKKVKVESDDNNKIVYVNIPKAEVQDVKVDPKNIRYFDEKLALFNVNEKEDANKAQVFAEKKAVENAVNTGILEFADAQAKTLIKGILSDAIPKGYKLKEK